MSYDMFLNYFVRYATEKIKAQIESFYRLVDHCPTGSELGMNKIDLADFQMIQRN